MSNAVRFVSTPVIHTPGMIKWLHANYDRTERLEKIRDWWPNAPEAAYQKLADGDYAIVDHETVVVHIECMVVDVNVAERFGQQ